MWQWERAVGRDDWVDIAGATESSCTPPAAEAEHFLRVTVTCDDERGADKTATALTAEVVTGPLLERFTLDCSQAVPLSSCRT